MVGRLDARSEHAVVQDALTMLQRMSHRGGCCEPGSGDGAGLLAGLPHEFFQRALRAPLGLDAPLPRDRYAIGQVFHGPRSRVDAVRAAGRAHVEQAATAQGLAVLGWRAVPVSRDGLGPVARGTEPVAEQVVLTPPPDMGTDEFERRLFLVRQLTSKDGATAGSEALSEFHLCSLSNQTIVYKGQLTPELLATYFDDLAAPDFSSHVAMVHSRFSTNTLPSWSRAQPNRLLAHNGEINTQRGNIQWMQAREGVMESSVLGREGLDAALPICSHELSDSGNFDRVLDLLTHCGTRSLHESVMTMVPPAWESDASVPPDVRAFHAFNGCAVEPWDGPAMLAFTDGRTMGACLDRNGLRPGRFYETHDGRVILASEVGVLPDLPEAEVARKGRLAPGRVFLVDFAEGRLVHDAELKADAAAQRPYADWVNRGLIRLDEWVANAARANVLAAADTAAAKGVQFTCSSATSAASSPSTGGSARGAAASVSAASDAAPPSRLASSAAAVRHDPVANFYRLRDRQRLFSDLRAFGFSTEHMDAMLTPMALSGKEALGSMGTDTPLAVMSRFPRPASAYAKQLFAQVTNPPIDPIRERLVTTLQCAVGPEGNLLEPGPEGAERLLLPNPLLLGREFAALSSHEHRGWRAHALDATFPRGGAVGEEASGSALRAALDRLCCESEAAAAGVDASEAGGARVLVLSDRTVGPDCVAVSSLLAVGAVHQHLVDCRLRTRVALVADAGDAREVHDFATLLGFGADAVHPHATLRALKHLHGEGLVRARAGRDMHVDALIDRYRAAVELGLTKVKAKMGISTLASYKGAQIFELVGLSQEVVERCFRGAPARVEGAGFAALERDLLRQHDKAYAAAVADAAAVEAYERALDEAAASVGTVHNGSGSSGAGPVEVDVPPPPEVHVPTLASRGELHYRHGGEEHMNTPRAITSMQRAVRAETRERGRDAWRTYVDETDAQNKKVALRGVLRFRTDRAAVPVEEVEPTEEVLRRFVTGAMSFGSISPEAHEALAVGMNRIGGRSNTGEGGEDAARFQRLPSGDSKRSAIKQIASGRFGVTSHYLANADELQIKMAQGAKPGEGGELHGSKVGPLVARIRHTVPGVSLISPPPHHDIYSIEDLAQLIFDLKNANPAARLSVKLVSGAGVGTVAAGVAKAAADHIVISGHDGGTGAAALTGVRNAGLPWELGLAEAQQTLVANGMRDRVVLQTDGQLKTGRDVVVAALLGAEEFGFSTAPLIAVGCIMNRKCHTNTCPVGVATQDPVLREKFAGAPEHIVNFMWMLAEDTREHMACLGFRSVQEMVGAGGDALEMDPDAAGAAGAGFKACEMDLSALLTPSRDIRADALPHWGGEMAPRGLDDVLDASLIRAAEQVLAGEEERVAVECPVGNVDRSVGAMLSHAVSTRFGTKGLPDGSIRVALRGHAGQSFGFALARGVTLALEGDANDYVGKALSGGRITLRPTPEALGAGFAAEDNVIAGNGCLYGSTSGELFARGVVGERFGVRMSGGTAVVEGTGDHAMEYATGGTLLILGRTGRNFAAGASGGVAFVLNEDGTFPERCNTETVELTRGLEQEDERRVRELLARHVEETSSEVARRLLGRWPHAAASFVKVFPWEYQRALAALAEAEGNG